MSTGWLGWLGWFWPLVMSGIPFCDITDDPSGNVQASCLRWSGRCAPSFSPASGGWFWIDDLAWEIIPDTGIWTAKIHYIPITEYHTWDIFTFARNINKYTKGTLPWGVRRALLVEEGLFSAICVCRYNGRTLCCWWGCACWSTWTITSPQFETVGFGLANSCSYKFVWPLFYFHTHTGTYI